MKKWMIWMLAGSLLLFGSVFGFWGFKQVMISRYLASMPVAAVPVTALQVEASNWTPIISAIGFIEPKRGVMLSASVSGVVSEVLFESGQPVENGTCCCVWMRIKSARTCAAPRAACRRYAANGIG